MPTPPRMGDNPPRELIALADDEGNSVTVNVTGRDPRWTAGVNAEVVVKTPCTAEPRTVWERRNIRRNASSAEVSAPTPATLR
ncbi:hypothetical protein GCM10010219_41150 [Streptomyces netropsis]|nr:hypothetical protein GCM10010219_41150 [Streptomyces netropsis]